MPDSGKNPDEIADALAPFRHKPFHILIHDRTLREQMQVILHLLKFQNVTVHPVGEMFLDNVRSLARLLIQAEGVFLIQPPHVVLSDSGKGRVRKELSDFFENVKLLLQKSKRDPMKQLSKCAPVFADIQLPQKREQTIMRLARYGVSGVFILKPQEALGALSPQLRKLRMEEQIRERSAEVREYLEDYLPHIDGALDELMRRQEERELSERKAEAESWMRQAETAKKARDFERAVACYKKAIDLLPADPAAYLESGKVYVRMKKYPKALLRFTQAEEVAAAIPEPNKEIGVLRILQVQERLESGEPSNAPALAALLEDALANFETAFKKAAKLKPLRPDEDENSLNIQAVTRIAGELIKLDLSGMLGKHHPVVAAAGALTRKAFQEVAKTDLDELPASHFIFLGLAAMDDGKFEEAESHFFRAARDQNSFSDACAEISYLGTVLRKQEGAAKAIGLYQKLLLLQPPNASAVYYNLAVAHSVEGNKLEAAGSIVYAVHSEPSLPENELFYKNHQIHEALHTVMTLFSRIYALAERVRAPQLAIKATQFLEKLEMHIQHREDKAAFKLLWLLADKIPEFYDREQVLASKILARFVEGRAKACRTTSRPELLAFAGFLEQFLAKRAKTKISKRLIAFMQLKAQTLRQLENGSDLSLAANLWAKAVVCHPEIIENPEFYANESLLALSRDIHEKLEKIDPAKIIR